ncbi:MAG: DUF3488 domain-containing protein [Deltaproteobacteria bacterium]|nr:MAG: DUF3488 domain-containing protein [Deltaproteobacteria bacterium]
MSKSLTSVRMALMAVLGLYAVTFQQWVGVVVLTLWFGLTLLPWRFELDRIGQIIFSFVGLGVAYVLVVVVGPPPKHPISEAFAVLQAFVCVWVLSVCLLRLMMTNPIMGHRGTVLISLLGIIACGGNQIGLTYHAFVIGYSGLALWALTDHDVSRPKLAKSTSRRWRLTVVGVSIAAVVAGSLFVFLPYAYRVVTKRLNLTFGARAQTGFDLYFKLGSLTSMIKSKRVVLRVHGDFQSSLHLRGIVYTRYNNKYWRVPNLRRRRQVRLPKYLSSNKTFLQIEHVAGDTTRFFVPLHSQVKASPAGFVRLHPMGLVLPLPSTEPDSITITVSDKGGIPVTRPMLIDREVPGKLLLPLKQLALQWTKGATSVPEKMHRLVSKLMTQYRYSLEFTRQKGRDPILDFLLHNKQGHCEYFASALALLARSIGMSARVVGGYMVSEYNRLGGYYIVREQNAHAWVEAWIPGKGWETYDATPPAGVASHMPKQTTWFSGLIDSIRMYFGRFQERLGRLSISDMMLVIGFFVLLWAVIRLRRWFQERKTEEAGDPLGYSDPLPAFQAMMDELSKTLPKRDSETLERYASRLQESQTSPAMLEAAQLLRDYASFRYGKRGNPEDLTQHLHRWNEQHTSLVS